ncbi:hypothetical protein ACFL2R_01425 [Patescibacteria group bacterium]
MKLKFLFFPVSLAIAATLTIWFIWPTWFDEKEGIAVIQQEIEEKKSELASVVSKKNNLASLGESMNSNGETNKKFTTRYYPEVEKNEIVVNELNQFAKNANVVIAAIAVESTEGVGARATRAKIPCLAVGEKVTSSRARREGAANITIEESVPEVVTVATKVVGTYEGIKGFLASVYGMEMINNISSIDIKSAADTTEDAGANDLEANLSFCLGFLPHSTVSLEGDFLEHAIFNESKFDFSYVDQLREMITKAASDIVIGQTSKPNPFVR